MKIASLSTGHCAAGLIAIAAIVAGCTSATPTGVGIPSAAPLTRSPTARFGNDHR
jgi:hypothetical protein